MHYNVYLFDFDYTLANSENGIVGCFHKTLQKLGYPDIADDKIRQTIGMPMEDATAQIIGTTDPARITAFIDIYRQEADRSMTPNTHFYEDTVPTLRALKAKGAQIAIISTKTRHRIEEKFIQDNVTDLLDFIIGREDVHTPKPDPEGILLAIQRFGVAKAAVLYTGDSFIDANAAQNAGVDFAAVTTGTTTADTFQSYPHVRIMKHLKEILA